MPRITPEAADAIAAAAEAKAKAGARKAAPKSTEPTWFEILYGTSAALWGYGTPDECDRLLALMNRTETDPSRLFRATPVTEDEIAELNEGLTPHAFDIAEMLVRW